MRSSFLPFALPDTDEQEVNEVSAVIRSGWITTGPRTRQFEQEFAAVVGAKHAVAVNSCTAAMHLALEGVGLQAGDLVVTTPYTFAATAEVIRYFNATPIFVDVEPDTLNINPALVANAVSALTRGRGVERWLPPALHNGHQPALEKRLKAIIPVHFAGLPANLDEINQVARAHGLAVIEDAAHAFPAQYKGRMIGTTARPDDLTAVCYSFYATKTMTTAEGGMLCTDNDAVAERSRVMALHGISKDAWKRYTAEGSWYYEITAPGFKYNMTDISAALGLVQLQKARQMWLRRQEIAWRYNAAFSALPELEPPTNRISCQHAWHLYPLRLHLDRLTIPRTQFIEKLKALNIGTSVHFIPLHLHPYYRHTYGYQPGDFPVAHREYQRVISLPIYSRMTDDDVNDVISAVTHVVGQYRRRRTVATAEVAASPL